MFHGSFWSKLFKSQKNYFIFWQQKVEIGLEAIWRNLINILQMSWRGNTLHQDQTLIEIILRIPTN